MDTTFCSCWSLLCVLLALPGWTRTRMMLQGVFFRQNPVLLWGCLGCLKLPGWCLTLDTKAYFLLVYCRDLWIGGTLGGCELIILHEVYANWQRLGLRNEANVDVPRTAVSYSFLGSCGLSPPLASCLAYLGLHFIYCIIYCILGSIILSCHTLTLSYHIHYKTV